MPNDFAASIWPGSTEVIAARTISAMYAPSFKEKATRIQAQSGSSKEGKIFGRPSHSSNTCTSRGLPRKNQIYAPAPHESPRKRDMRISARKRPSITPQVWETTDNHSVVQAALRKMKLGSWKRKCQTTSQRNTRHLLSNGQCRTLPVSTK